MNRFFILFLLLQYTGWLRASNEIDSFFNENEEVKKSYHFNLDNEIGINHLIRNKVSLSPSTIKETFKHFNFTRSTLFPQAIFKGSYTGNNKVKKQSSSPLYPSGFNMAYLDDQHVFIYGIGDRNEGKSNGVFIARVNPQTLEPIWLNELSEKNKNEEWNYPGSMGILKNGGLYVTHGYYLSKIDPESGLVLKRLTLPIPDGAKKHIAYDGFNTTPDGILTMKSVYRNEQCKAQGVDVSLNCLDVSNTFPTVLVSIDPDRMEVIDTINLSSPVTARPTISDYRGDIYLYLVEADTVVRYFIEKGKFRLDNTWKPGIIILPGQTTGTSFVVMDDWIVGQVNALPSATPLSVIAIHQSDALRQYSIQPFYGDPISSSVASAFSKAAYGGESAVSWAPASVSVDPGSHLIYATDSIVGYLAAVRMTTTGLITLWKVDQATTELTTLIGSEKARILVGTDIPRKEIPGKNLNDYVVWRNGSTGEELARSPLLPSITPGTMIQPYYLGAMFYESQLGKLIKLEPVAKKRRIK